MSPSGKVRAWMSRVGIFMRCLCDTATTRSSIAIAQKSNIILRFRAFPENTRSVKDETLSLGRVPACRENITCNNKVIVGRVRRAPGTIVSARFLPRRNPTPTPHVGLRCANPTYQRPTLGPIPGRAAGGKHRPRSAANLELLVWEVQSVCNFAMMPSNSGQPKRGADDVSVSLHPFVFIMPGSIDAAFSDD
jgi:hypothetical protein